MKTKDVADFIVSSNIEKPPPNVISQAKLCTLDILGAAIAGSESRSVRIMEGIVRSMGEGNKQATMIGYGLKASLLNATLVNSAMSTVLDSDDGCMSPVGHLGHIGGCVVPAALAAAEYQQSSGEAYIEAVAVGYEVYLRTGRILTEPALKKFPLAGTPGAYGATAAAGKLLKLTNEQIVNALGIAEAYAPVPRMGRIALTGPMTKEAMPWGSMTGVMAALLARKGFTGPKTIYDDNNYDRSCLYNLGESYELLKVYFKPYCACRYTHAALDIVIKLLKEQVFTSHDAIDITVEGGAGASLLNTVRPATIEHAEYSFPFVIGAALSDGEVGPDQMRESRLNDETLLKQADKVKVVFSEEVNALLPARFGAIVTVETRDGRKHRIKREFPRGEPEEPLTSNEVEEKFRKWATTRMSSSRAEEILNLTKSLENLDHINRLLELLTF